MHRLTFARSNTRDRGTDMIRSCIFRPYMRVEKSNNHWKGFYYLVLALASTGAVKLSTFVARMRAPQNSRENAVRVQS